jgi:hypothetical protein
MDDLTYLQEGIRVAPTHLRTGDTYSVVHERPVAIEADAGNRQSRAPAATDQIRTADNIHSSIYGRTIEIDAGGSSNPFSTTITRSSAGTTYT